MRLGGFPRLDEAAPLTARIATAGVKALLARS